MKVFLSIDMEGVSGLVRWADVAKQGQDYPRNRSLLTAATNAAIEGAFRLSVIAPGAIPEGSAAETVRAMADGLLRGAS